MKILQAINSLDIGGAESLLVDFAIGLTNQGYECDILVLHDTNSYLKDRLSQYNIRYICLSDTSLYPFSKFLYMRKLIKKYDVIHTHLFPMQYWIALATMFLPSLKLVTTEHCTSNERRTNVFFKIVDKIVYSGYTNVVGVSDLACENLKKHLKTSNVLAINNGVPLARFIKASPLDRKSVNLEFSDFVISMVARFYYPKDQSTIIRALPLLDQNVHVVFVGDGKELNSCRLLAKNIGVEDRVHFLGFRKDIPEILQMSDCIAIASHSEGLSLSSIEGMAVGKPFIASNVAGLKEIVAGYGLLFKDKDSEAFAEQVKKVMFDSQYYDKVAKSCAMRAHDFSIELMIDKYLEIYNNEK